MPDITTSLIEIIGSILGIALIALVKAAFDALKGVETSKYSEAIKDHLPAVHGAAKDLLYDAIGAGRKELLDVMTGDEYEDLRDRLLKQANLIAHRAGVKQDVHEELVDGILQRAAEEVRLGIA